MTQITYAELLSFSDKCQSAKTPADVTRPFAVLLGKQGIKSHFVGSVGYIDSWKGFGFDEIPPSWRKRYVEQAYYKDDAVFHHAQRGGAKTTWTEARRAFADRGLGPRGRLVEDEAAAAGLSNGLIMPIQGYGDLPAVVTYGGHDLDLSDDAQASLFVVGALAYESLRRFAQTTAPLPPVLTVQEMRVLRWTAEGKSATDIAVILKLSEHTVREYHARIRSKYGVSSNVQAAVYAALDGQLKRASEL